MKLHELFLRPVEPGDTYPLWIWANDPDTRAASHGRPPIAWNEHRQWLAGRAADPSTLMWMAATKLHRPVGSIRFQTEDGWQTARLSYVIAPEARGHGWARPMLVEAVAELLLRHPKVSIEADVMRENERSLHLFRDLGWTEVETTEQAVRFSRREDDA